MQKGNKLLILTFPGPVPSFGSGRFLNACIKKYVNNFLDYFSVSKTLVNKQKACKPFSQSLPIPSSNEFQLNYKNCWLFLC
jgi:hypothetical protein